jgi:hypothetical protein
MKRHMLGRIYGRASFDHLRGVSNSTTHRRKYILLICPDADERSTRSRGDKASNEQDGYLSFREMVLFTIQAVYIRSLQPVGAYL